MYGSHNPRPAGPPGVPGVHQPEWWIPLVPPAEYDARFDTSVPHPARVYNCWLGGKDNFEADRKAAEEVMRLRPQVVASAQANRAFLARVVRYLTGECGIRQFLDIGTGLPGQRGSNIHELAQQADPGCRVVYTDNDPVVGAHARALLAGNSPHGGCEFSDADLREPEVVLAAAAKTLDFTRPAAILLLAVAHFLTDRDRPAGIIAKLASALAPGSYLVISHLTADLAPEQVAAAVAAYNNLAPTPVTARSHAQVTGLFGGLPLVAPGVVPIAQWRPPIGQLPQPADLHAGVARIRHPAMGRHR